jgi:hypothetical protein
MRLSWVIIAAAMCCGAPANAFGIDVSSPFGACAAVLGLGATDETSAVQCHLDAAGALGGMPVAFPPGRYMVRSVTVPRGVWVNGSGLWSTSINAIADLSPVIFANAGGACIGGNHYGGMTQIAVNGYQTAPTAAAVVIGEACNVTIRDASLLYGSYGLDNRGIDSRIEASFVWGYTGALKSSGANWYKHVKFDQPGAVSAFYGLNFTSPVPSLTSVAENQFTDCDVSGNYSYAVYINDDTSTKAITKFTGVVFSSPINVANAKATMFGPGNEYGSTIFYVNSGYVSIGGGYAYSPTTVTGLAVRKCDGSNIQITC